MTPKKDLAVSQAPLLRTLEQRLQTCTNARQWAFARIQQGLYLARTSCIDEAVPIPAEVRAQFVGREDAEVYCWLWMLEAVLEYFRTGTTNGFDRLQRALGVATALNIGPLKEYLAAWAAHFRAHDSKFEEMVEWLKSSRLHEAALPEAACRACMTVANAWQTVGENRAATAWYARARDFARPLGDRASIMASIANRAAIRLDEAWVGSFFDQAHGGEELRDIEAEMLSALAYERVTGSDAFVLQTTVTRVRFAAMKNDFAAALELASAGNAVTTHESQSMVRMKSILTTWLKYKALGELPSEKDFHAAAEQEIHKLDLDDAAVSWVLMSQLALAMKDKPRARKYGANAATAYGALGQSRARLRECLERAGGAIAQVESLPQAAS
jgi:hypothetical protein